jgi:hypothetical protein
LITSAVNRLISASLNEHHSCTHFAIALDTSKARIPILGLESFVEFLCFCPNTDLPEEEEEEALRLPLAPIVLTCIPILQIM